MNLKKTSTDDLIVCNQVNETLTNYFNGALYFPSRVRYLRAIIQTIQNLGSEHRYVFLALNSSVGNQNILGREGFNFRDYFSVFRERINYGDLIIRIFCLQDIPQIPFSLQLENIRSVVNELHLNGMVNTYLPRREPFNCVYILPLKGDFVSTESIAQKYRELINIDFNKENWKEFLNTLKSEINLEESVIYREIIDYDTNDDFGCGYKINFQHRPEEVIDRINEYFRISGESNSVFSDINNPDINRFQVGIVVALPVELQAVERQLGSSRLIEYQEYKGIVFYQGTFSTKFGEKISILVAKLPESGNIMSAIATTLLVNTFEVKYIFGLGIAGGLKGKINLGDVIIAKWAIYFEKAKILPDGSAKPDFRIHEAAFTQLERYHDASSFTCRLTKKPPNIKDKSIKDTTLVTKAYFDCGVLSGEKLMAEPKLINNLREDVLRKLIAVENEATGIYMASSYTGTRVKYITIKGISDYADDDKDDAWHEYAADASAAYAFHFLDKEQLH